MFQPFFVYISVNEFINLQFHKNEVTKADDN